MFKKEVNPILAPGQLLLFTPIPTMKGAYVGSLLLVLIVVNGG
jgi:hypothetical protein